VLLGIFSYLEVVAKVLFDHWGGADYVMSISTRMITHQKEERGLLHCFASPIVVSELCDREISCPVVLLMVDKEMQIGLHPLIIPFQLSIGSRMICGGYVLLDSQGATQFSDELRCESRIPVAYNFIGESVSSNYDL